MPSPITGAAAVLPPKVALAMSSPGMISEKIAAASITPAAKPSRVSCRRGERVRVR
jgi:hypothetical protein